MTANRETGKVNIFTMQLVECFCVLICVNLSYSLTFKLMYNSCFPFGVVQGGSIYLVISALTLISLGWIGYFSVKERPLPETVTKVFLIVAMMNLIFIALLYFSCALRLPLYLFIIADTFQFGLLLFFRAYFSRVRSHILSLKKVLVVLDEEQKQSVLKKLHDAGIRKLALLDYRNEHLHSWIASADYIYMSAEVPQACKNAIISDCVMQEKELYVVPETYEIALRKSQLAQVGDVPVFNIKSFALTESQKFFKRTLDICGSMVGLLLTAPAMIIVAILIKREDGGSVFYRQVRSGIFGREFQVIKFRSMRADAEKLTGAVFASDGDPRVTKIGRFLRATRLDEVPQFFNVLKGEMSLVGPRPERPVFVEQFAEEIPGFRNRMAVKPGITGLAQTMGNYTTEPDNKLRFDMVYIRDYSLVQDIRILFKTVKVVFTKEQSAGFADCDEKAGCWELSEPWEKIPQGVLHTSATVDDATTPNSEHGTLVSQRRLRHNFLQDVSPLKQPRKSHSVAKGVLISFCCIMIVFGTMALRYMSIAVDVFAASQQIFADAGFDISGDEAVLALAGGYVPALDTDKAAVEAGAAGWGESEAGNPNPPSDDLSAKSDTVISAEDIQRAYDRISLSDKVNLVYKLITRIEPNDLILLEQMARGGFTQKEKDRAKEMVYKYYNEEEIGQIYQLYREFVK